MRKPEPATYRQLVRIAHAVLEKKPALERDPDLSDVVKAEAARLNFSWNYSREIYAAVESAVFQRRRKLEGSDPKWKAEWTAKQRAERLRRSRYWLR